MTYREAFEQLEYTIVCRMEILSAPETNPQSERSRLHRLYALEKTWLKMQEFEQRVQATKPSALKVVR